MLNPIVKKLMLYQLRHLDLYLNVTFLGTGRLAGLVLC